jgi:NADPH:quinone reductase-like Zn-dependent oxidoreductase
MKAVRIHEFGGPATLQIEDLPPPKPAAGELLVKVMAASVNPIDYKIRNGGYLSASALPVTLGRDLAGLVELAASEASAFKLGDAIFAMLDRDHGGYAEFAAVKAQYCARKPERLDFIQAAAVPVAGLTAWQGLFDHGGLQPGQRVLIHGGAGGVGHFAVQFARTREAEVIATCSGQDRDFVSGLGASQVIDYHGERFEDRVQDVDLVFDLVGGETQDRSWAVLKAGGVLVSTTREPDKDKAAQKNARGVHYMAEPNGAQLTEIARLIEFGEVMPTVARVFPLEEAAKAESQLEEGHVRGKIVLDVRPV